MIVATPLDLPNLEPDSWEVFWQTWNKHAAPLVKRSMNTDTSAAAINSNTVWVGMDIFKKDFGITHWEANYVDISSLLPNLYKSLESLPIENIYRVRLISNMVPIPAHTDDNLDRWSVRYLLYNENVKPVWYFTPPGRDNKDNKTYFSLPKETNWFAYNDKYCWHGCDYDKINKKVLMQIYYFSHDKELVYRSIEKFRDKTVVYE